MNKMKNRSLKRIVAGIFILFLITAISFWAFYERILLQAGNFMAPVGDYQADVAILEGHEVIPRGIIKHGTDLLSSGRVNRIVVVLQNVIQANRPYGFNEQYPGIVKKKLRKLGLKDKEFKVIVIDAVHPVTLTEAKIVLHDLSKDHVKTAILLSSGFHTRRSYLVYQHIGEPLQIRIFPCAFFASGNMNERATQEQGLRELAMEFFKLGYYLVRGYIPWKFSY